MSERSRPPHRVLYVHNSADTYGASRSLLRLVTTLDRVRFEPVVVLPAEGELARQLRRFHARVFIYPQLTIISRYVKAAELFRFFRSVPQSTWFLLRTIRRERIDLVHTNVGVIPTAALAAWLADVPHVWHIREFFSEFKSLWRVYRLWILFGSRQVVAVSRAAAAQFGATKKVRVIHNGFQLDSTKSSVAGSESNRATVFVDRFQDAEPPDLTMLREEFRRRHNLGNELVVGCVGRIKFQRKGQDVFIRALGELKRRGVRVRGLIVGAPFSANEAHWKEVHDLIRQEDVERETVLAGELKDVRPAYAAMDVCVLPSALPEPFGGVVLEAMCMQLPVIATNIGGSSEQVQDGVTGFLVPPNDAEALARRIEQLARSSELRAKFGVAGLARIRERFTLSGTTAEIQALYDRLLTPKIVVAERAISA